METYSGLRGWSPGQSNGAGAEHSVKASLNSGYVLCKETRRTLRRCARSRWRNPSDKVSSQTHQLMRQAFVVWQGRIDHHRLNQGFRKLYCWAGGDIITNWWRCCFWISGIGHSGLSASIRSAFAGDCCAGVRDEMVPPACYSTALMNNQTNGGSNVARRYFRLIISGDITCRMVYETMFPSFMTLGCHVDFLVC